MSSKKRKLKFVVHGSVSGAICIPEEDGKYGTQNYLCKDGKVYDWMKDKDVEKGKSIVYYDSREQAAEAIRIYESGRTPSEASLVKLKNMVNDLRIRFNPELLVEVYKFVESM